MQFLKKMFDICTSAKDSKPNGQASEDDSNLVTQGTTSSQGREVKARIDDVNRIFDALESHTKTDVNRVLAYMKRDAGPPTQRLSELYHLMLPHKDRFLR